MPDDNILRVGAAVDLGALQSGMAQAAALVSQGVSPIVDAFGRAQVASQQATKSILSDWAGRPFAPATSGSDQLRQSIDLSAESIKALSEAMKGAKSQSEGTASSWEKFADHAKEFIEHPLESAGEGAKSLILGLGPIGTVALAAGTAIMELGHKAFELVNEEGAAARQTQNLASRLGMTFEEAKKLSEMAKLVGADIGGLARAAMKLSDALQNPDSKEAEELHRIGVTATETGPALLQILEKLSEITNKTERMAEARKLLQRSAVSLQPVIEDYEKLSSAIESLGGKVSEDAVQGLLEANLKINEMAVAWDHLKVAFAAKLSPIVTVVVEAVVKAVSKPSSMFDITGMGAKADALEVAAAKKEEEKDKEKPDLKIEGFGKSFINVKTLQQQWTDSYHNSLKGLQSDLEKLETKQKDLSNELRKPVSLDHPFDQKKVDEFNANAKAIETLQEKVKAAEKAKSGANVAERNALAEKQIDQEKKIALTRVEIIKKYNQQLYADGVTTLAMETEALLDAEEQRYQIELDAAKRTNELKAQTAKAEKKPVGPGISLEEIDLKNQENKTAINQKSADEEKKFADFSAKYWIDSISRMSKEREKDLSKQITELSQEKKLEMAAANTTEQSELALAKVGYEQRKDLIEADFQAKRISVRQKIELLKELEQQEFDTAMAAAKIDLASAAGDDPEAIAKAQAKVDMLEALHARTMGKLSIEASKALMDNKTVAIQYLTTVSNAFEKGFGSWLEGHKRFTQAMAQSFRQMANEFIINLLRMQAQRLIFDMVNRTASEKEAIIAAKVAAVKAYKAAGDLPFPANVIVGAASAAAVFAAAMSFATFEHGGVVPRTQLSLVHGGERVLTPRDNASFERALAGGADGGQQNHYHAAPGESPDSVTRNAAAFQRWMRDGRRVA